MRTQSKKAPSTKLTRSSFTKVKKNFKITQKAEKILAKVKTTEGLTIDDFVSKAIIEYSKTIFDSKTSSKKTAMNGKVRYLATITAKNQYELLKLEKPETIQNIAKKINKISFDINNMSIQLLKKACKPCQVDYIDLYTVAFAMKYGFHEDE